MCVEIVTSNEVALLILTPRSSAYASMARLSSKCLLNRVLHMLWHHNHLNVGVDGICLHVHNSYLLLLLESELRLL